MQSLSSADSTASLGRALLAPGLVLGAGYKARSFALIPAGTLRLLDVGSGTGDDALELSERLGPNATVMGIDRRLEAVDEALEKARNVALNVRFAVGDAHSLPFEDAAFDVVRADFLFGAVEQPLRAVRELSRVLCAHGTLLLSDRSDVLGGELGVMRAFERAGFGGLRVVDRFRRDGRPGLTARGLKP
ncbi:MAG: methyltransferase domain-containing protein [Myxococcota bacterium]|nr:methyltransferase domain-containing protein [Myxococcota bacterium]